MPNKKTKCLHCYKYPRTGKVCSECKKVEAQATRFKPVRQAWIDKLPCPAGFVKTTGEGYNTGMGPDRLGILGVERPWWRESSWVLFESESEGMRIAMNVANLPAVPTKWVGKGRNARRVVAGKPMPSASGHTSYKDENGHWRTFDRHGVGDSFGVGDYGEDPNDMATVLSEQITRCVVGREKSKQMVQIPGFGFRIHRDQIEEVKKLLKSGGRKTFTPSGFGTGHILSIKQSRYSKRLPQETAEFFGVNALYDETFDHD